VLCILRKDFRWPQLRSPSNLQFLTEVGISVPAKIMLQSSNAMPISSIPTPTHMVTFIPALKSPDPPSLHGLTIHQTCEGRSAPRFIFQERILMTRVYERRFDFFRADATT